MVSDQEHVEYRIYGPQPGPQTEVLLCPEYELLFGGSKFSGKTEAGRLFLLKGNPDQPQIPRTAAVSYIYHPAYRALILRKNVTDFEDWIGQARQLYEHPQLGGKWVPSQRLFMFPHPVTGRLEDGARFIIGHLAEENAYQKYMGREFQRMLIEELTQIPTEGLYTNVTSCCRSTFKDLRAQVMATTNPEGQGLQWVKKRWMFHPKTGIRVPPRTRIVESFNNPVTGKVDEVTRIFIPATIRDNLIGLAADPVYVSRLMALPDAQRRAYLDGDWDIMAGDTYFPEFREHLMPGEPANAVHCVQSSTVRIEPWAVRWAGGDWGYQHPAAFYWGTKSEADSRLYVYRELVTRHMGSYDLGVTFARQTLPDLAGMDPPFLTLWLSPDAFSNRDASAEGDSTSIVSQFTRGIRDVMGAKSVYVPEAKELEVEGVASEEAEDFFYRKALTERANIVIRRAPNQRVAGWSYMRELLSWKVQDFGIASFDREYASRILLEPDGLAKYFRYIEAHQKLAERPELPLLRIFSDRCPRLIQGIKRLTFADDLIDARKSNADQQTGENGDDEVDGCRYLIMGYQRSQMRVPASVERHRKLRLLKEQYGGTPLYWQALDKMDQDKNYKNSSNPVKLHRNATHPSRRLDANWQSEKLRRDQQEAQHSWFQSFTSKLGPFLD